MLAVAEINAAGGLLGREIELVIGDCGATPEAAAIETASLIEFEEVSAIVGMHPSDIRQSVVATLRGRVPYVYTPQYEGGDLGSDVLAIGDTAADLGRPGIGWLRERCGVSRFFLLGNDYVWPRVSLPKIRTIVQSLGGSVVGERLLPFDTVDYEPIFDAIRRRRADAVIMLLLGLEGVRFHRAFVAAGLAGRVRRFALATDETVLYAIGPENVEGLLVASSYFSSIRSAANATFLESYHDCFGETAPPPNAFGQSCYEGFHTLAAITNASGRIDARALLDRDARHARGRTARRARPAIEIGERHIVHLAAADEFDFRVVASY
jgi:ABC-type branched-subunit amino acid transport system substrate-binding protein